MAKQSDGSYHSSGLGALTALDLDGLRVALAGILDCSAVATRLEHDHAIGRTAQLVSTILQMPNSAGAAWWSANWSGDL